MQGYTLNITRQWYPGTSSCAEPTTYIRTLLFLLPPFFTAPPSARLMKLSLFFLLLTSCAVPPPRKDKTGRGRLCTNVRIKTCKKGGQRTENYFSFLSVRPTCGRGARIKMSELEKGKESQRRRLNICSPKKPRFPEEIPCFCLK